jgi:hypothetical protein
VESLKSSGALEIAEIATPSNPASGSTKIYPKTDGKLYLLDDAGVETVVGSGSGQGEKNYIANGDAETNITTGWVTYDDGASAVPVNGIDGSSSTITLTNQATTILNGTRSFKLAKSAADGQGEGISYDFTIDKADQSKLLKIEMSYAVDGTYTAGDLRCYVYDVTNDTLITPTSTSFGAWDKDSAGAAKLQVGFAATTSSSGPRSRWRTSRAAAATLANRFQNAGQRISCPCASHKLTPARKRKLPAIIRAK